MSGVVVYNPEQSEVIFPVKVSISLSRAEWKALADIVNTESGSVRHTPDKYIRALLYPLLKQIFVKLHNKIHSLKAEKNVLNLTLPEASVLGSALLELNSENYLVTYIVSIIDQKLT